MFRGEPHFRLIYGNLIHRNKFFKLSKTKRHFYHFHFISNVRTFWANFYRPQRGCAKVMFLQLSVILFTGEVSIPAYTTGHMTRGCLSRGCLSRGVSVQGGLCLGDLCLGGLCQEDPPYGNERVVCILVTVQNISHFVF